MLLTLIFPKSASNALSPTVPSPQQIASVADQKAMPLPTTANALQPFSQDTALAFAVPWNYAPTFLTKIRDVAAADAQNGDATDESGSIPSRRWTMKAANKAHGSRRAFGVAVRDAWIGFVDLIKVSLA